MTNLHRRDANSQRTAANSQLSAAEVQRITANRARAHAIAPGFVDLVRDFHRAGLVEGWRNVRFVGTPAEHAEYARDLVIATCRLTGNEGSTR